MNNPNTIDPQNVEIRHLTPKLWEDTRQRAQSMIITRLKEPAWSEFAPAQVQGSRVTTYVVYGLLIVVALAAFLISAGKQVIAFSLISVPLLIEYPEWISTLYITVGIIASLTLNEFGVILFGYAAKVRARDPLSSTTLRVFQFLCVTIALGGNITVTALNIVAEAAVFEWIVAITAPLIVMGVGTVIEQAAIQQQEAYQAARTTYTEALKQYRLSRADPESDPRWLEVWGREILESLSRLPGQRPVIEAMIAADDSARVRLVAAEYQRQSWSVQLKQLTEPIAVSPVSPSVSGTGERRVTGVSPSQLQSGVSGAVSGETPRMTARRLLAEQPELMNVSLAELVRAHGLNESAWSRAKGDIKAEQLASIEVPVEKKEQEQEVTS